MNQDYIYKIISQMVDDDQAKNRNTPRSLLRFLLPIDKAFGYYTSNKVEFYDPKQKQIFYRNFNVKNEDTRLQSIDYINGRIDYFNRSIQSVKNNSYKVIDHVKKWAIKIRLSRPIIESDRNPFNRNESSLIRIINDKKMYNAASVLKNTDFVICLNKTIYDYLTKLSGGKQLVPQNTLYQPILEYEDWFMSSGISIEDTPSLFDYLKVKSPSKNPVVYALDKMTNKINVTYSIRANPEDKKWYSSRTEGKVINLIESGLLEDYVSDCKFKNIDKINMKKLSEKLNCSDKTAKKLLALHAPHLIDD